ncbi:MAG: hypothetical protein L3J26_03025 [Candidatus Polarisedimenticolaceae bacterium]|nr:hypothetical protein [Candidatus Polarisedimenticolaceae bacterium]
MVRKLALLSLSAALLMPGGAFALGLGEIHLKSALNQTFDAKIDLLSVKADELDGVKVTLATQEAFERAGVDRLFILTKLRYEPDLNEEGKPVIHVTSRQAIREPFLNFLIEVNWAKGRLIREYTVLLDPPVTLDRKPAPVAPPATEPSAPVAKAARQPLSEPSPPATVRERPTVPYTGVGEYGPVMANESLWRIASKTKPQGATVEQMMMALQRKNPQAFSGQNVNNLKRGSILRMPTQEEIDLLSVREARAEFSNQVAAWKASRAMVAASDAGSEPEATADKKQPAPASKLELASVRPEGEGKGGESEGDGTEEITSRLENELILAREQFESAKQERNDLSSQVSQLESQLTDLENLLVVRNEQLARLQNELSQSEVDIAPEIDEAPVAEAAVDIEDIELETLGADEEELEIIDIEGEASDAEEIVLADVASQEEPSAAAQEAPQLAAAPEVSEPAPTESIFDTLKDLLENNMIAVAGGGLAILLLLLLLARRRSAESEEFEESILIDTQGGGDTESLGSPADDTEAGMSEAAETSFLSEFSHSDMDVLQDDTGEVDPVAEADVYIAYGRYQQAEELLRQAIERDPEQIKSHLKLLEILFVTKNVQAFTETAEILVAKNSGQLDVEAWQQVVAMGHQLNPGHELFADAEGESAAAEQSATAVEVESEALADVGDDDLELMDLSELTADFDMNADAVLDQEEGPISAILEDDGLDFDLNLGLDSEKNRPGSDDALLSADLAEISADAALDDALLDISAKLPDDASTSKLDADTETSELEESLSLDGLDLGDPFGSDTLDESGSILATDSEALLGESEDLAAELSSLTDEPIGKQASDRDERPLDDALKSDNLGAELEEFSSLDESLSIDDFMEESLEQQGSSNEALDTDGLVLADPESAAPENETVEPLASDEGLIIEDESTASFLMEEPLSELVEEPDEIDKINTKLDLARAYVEMGDEEGARSILDEVMSEGDDAQKGDAQELLGRLS